jgi:CubicO group peptidase (beta-lactamase class C family)
MAVADEVIREALREVLERACCAEGAPGVVGAVRVGEREASVAIGSADPASGVAMASSVRLRLSSMVKPFTALAVLAASERGLIDLDGAIADQLESIAVPPGPTVRDLLTHTGGLRRSGFFHVGPNEAVPSVRDFYSEGVIESAFPPGTSFEYSNHGYALLGELLAETAGVPYASAVAQTVLDPLGVAIDFDETATHAPGFGLVGPAQVVSGDDGSDLLDINGLGQFPLSDFGTDIDVADGAVVRMPNYQPVLTPASGCWTTIDDLLRLPSAIVNGGLPLAAGTIELLSTNSAHAGLPPRSIGFSLEHVDGELVASHTGGWPGYSGTVGFCPTRRIAFAVMANMSIDARGDLAAAIVQVCAR